MKTMSKEKSKKRAKTFFTALICIILIIAVLLGAFAAVSAVGIKSNHNFIESISAVSYDNQLVPETDDNGYTTFVTDRDFKIMQLTDIHIGAGFMSINKDSMAINAVAAMITAEKPDLVVVTGDIAYPVPVQAGTANNKNSAVMFADLMEQLGVYWCPVFGNHDTEVYSYYSRADIAELYESEEYPHCLFQKGPSDIYGEGNYVVNVKNTSGEITQSLIMIDSNSYTDNGLLSWAIWNYDCIHKDQVQWYENEIKNLTELNGGVTPKSLAFFHIAPIEQRNAWNEYTENGYQDTEDVKYIYGKAGEQKLIVYSSELNEGFFDAVLSSGSTQGIFFGHDHLNNFSLEYKGIRLTYGYSIDYLAYRGIMKYGAQRGCTIIDVYQNGEFDCRAENYYQDKYSTVKDKEAVTMEDYYS